MPVSDNIASSYLDSLDRNISVSVMSKLRKFPMYQELGYNGQLSHLKKDFHGLQEFLTHMGMYSASHIILTVAWRIIKSLVPNNPFIALKMIVSQSLGSVGNLFLQIPGFGKVFGVSVEETKDIPSLGSKITSFSSQVGSI